MKKWMRTLIPAAAAILILAACGQDEEPAEKVTAEEVKQEAGEAAEAAATFTQQEMDSFVEQMEGQLANFDAKIEDLQSRAESLSGEAREDVDQKLSALKDKRDQAREKLEALKSSSADAWEELKSGLQSAMFELNRAMENAAAEFG